MQHSAVIAHTSLLYTAEQSAWLRVEEELCIMLAETCIQLMQKPVQHCSSCDAQHLQPSVFKLSADLNKLVTQALPIIVLRY
jgi:hypothetical protein